MEAHQEVYTVRARGESEYVNEKGDGSHSKGVYTSPELGSEVSPEKFIVEEVSPGKAVGKTSCERDERERKRQREVS